MPSKTKKRKKKCPVGQKWTKLPIPEDAPPGTKAKFGCKFMKGRADVKDPDDPRHKKKKIERPTAETPKDPSAPKPPEQRN